MIRLVLLEALRLYQAARSALGPPCCRFQPSCSEFAREAVDRLGPLRAAPRVAGRLARCHPWHPGGYDPVRTSA